MAAARNVQGQPCFFVQGLRHVKNPSDRVRRHRHANRGSEAHHSQRHPCGPDDARQRCRLWSGEPRGNHLGQRPSQSKVEEAEVTHDQPRECQDAQPFSTQR